MWITAWKAQHRHPTRTCARSTRSEPSRIVRCCSAFRALSLPTRMSSGFGYWDGKSAAASRSTVQQCTTVWIYTTSSPSAQPAAVYVLSNSALLGIYCTYMYISFAWSIFWEYAVQYNFEIYRCRIYTVLVLSYINRILAVLNRATSNFIEEK